MAIIDQLLIELDGAKEFEEIRIRGYSEMLCCPLFLTDEARNEVQQAKDWSDNRLRLIVNAIITTENLINDGYPERDEQRATSNVIAEFNERLRVMTISIGEFKEIPSGVLTVGDEVATN
jgi:hypothetical protein